MRLLLLAASLAAASSVVSAEMVTSLITKTDNCALCGMTAGEISIEVCGNMDCCLGFRLDNDDITFLPGSEDVFTGEANLKECAEFQIGDKDLGQIQITLHHEGSDGLELEWVDVVTDERTVRCNIGGTDIDGDEWLQFLCFN